MKEGAKWLRDDGGTGSYDERLESPRGIWLECFEQLQETETAARAAPSFRDGSPCANALPPHITRDPGARYARLLDPTRLAPTPPQRRTARISARDRARIVRVCATGTARAAKRRDARQPRPPAPIRLVDVVLLGSLLSHSVAGGEHLHETGDRGVIRCQKPSHVTASPPASRSAWLRRFGRSW